MNVLPFVNAVTALRGLITPQTSFVRAEDFLSAANQLHASLGSEFIPGFSERSRQDLRVMIDQIHALADNQGNIFRIPLGTFLLQDLRDLGLFPPKEVLENEEALRAILSRFVTDSAEGVADSVQEGGIRLHSGIHGPQTLHGFDEFDNFDDTMVVGAIATDGHFHIRRPVQVTLQAVSPVVYVSEDDDADRRPTLQRNPQKPVTARPIIDIVPSADSPLTPLSEPEPLEPPPPREAWQAVWQDYRKGGAPLEQILERYRRGEIPLDFLRDAVQSGEIPYVDLAKEVAGLRLAAEEFMELLLEGVFPLDPLLHAVSEGKVPLFLSSSREEVAQKFRELGFEPGKISLQKFLDLAADQKLPLELVRTALQEGLIPYRQVIDEIAAGRLAPEGFLKIFTEGTVPIVPLLLGLRQGKIPALLFIEAVQAALREGKIPFESFLAAMQEGRFPLVNAANGRLLIQNPVYMNVTGQSIPTIIESDFQLGKVIGQGGCSEVYLGLQSGTEREVAIKVVTIPDQRKRDKILQGFQEEIRHAPFSNSPRFVHVYATGRTSQENPFIAMELLRGGALADHLENIRTGKVQFNLNEMLSLACEVVAPVAEMHRHGYIHRDIKTENYFRDEAGKVKLGDQGLRKTLADIPPEPEQEPWGTPGYMPPEKVLAEAADSERTDVFALGVVLYEIFTSIFCFEGYAAHTTLVNVTTKKPPLPSDSAPKRDIPQAVDRVIMKCLEKDPAKRYLNASELLYELVTVHAQELEAEANSGLRLSSHTGADVKIHEDIWQEKIQAAIRELQKVYNEYPHPEIRAKMVEMNYSLYVWADRVGNQKELERTRENILKLAPGGPEAKKVQQRIQVNFLTEGERPPGTNVAVQLRHYEHRAGYFELDRTVQKKDDLPRKPLTLERGGLYTAQFSGDGLVSFIRDIPVRPGEYDLRVPLYLQGQIPGGWVLIPAGPTAARTSNGSFAEYFDNWREIDYDYAAGPLQTNADYYHYIKILAQEDRDQVPGRMPRHWGFDFFDAAVHRHKAFHYKNGQPIDWLAPVTHITRDDALVYLANLDKVLRQNYNLPSDQSIRFPTLYEWRRTFRPDPREWAHGDGRPQVGDMAIRFRDPRGAGPIAPLPIIAPNIRDIAHFSVGDIEALSRKYAQHSYRRVNGADQANPPPPASWMLDHDEGTRLIVHPVGNVQKFLHIGGADDHTRITKALGLENGELGTKFMATAGADCSMSPDNPDILNKHSVDADGLIGIMPVIQLRSVPSSPSLKSLTARYLP